MAIEHHPPLSRKAVIWQKQHLGLLTHSRQIKTESKQSKRRCKAPQSRRQMAGDQFRVHRVVALHIRKKFSMWSNGLDTGLGRE